MQDTPINRIQARISQIEAALASIEKLRAELNELRIAQRVISQLANNESENYDTIAFSYENKMPVETMTMKQAILFVLENAPEIWLTTQQVGDRVSELLRVKAGMPTIASTLSNLKKANFILRDGPKVAHAEKNKASANAEA